MFLVTNNLIQENIISTEDIKKELNSLYSDENNNAQDQK